MLIGSDGLGWIEFDNYRLVRLIGTIALVLILFDGGLSAGLGRDQAGLTKPVSARPVRVPSLLPSRGGERVVSLRWYDRGSSGAPARSATAPTTARAGKQAANSWLRPRFRAKRVRPAVGGRVPQLL
jgi:cell volume regulation protein A